MGERGHWKYIMDGVGELIVVSGPPGSGKTTVAQAVSTMFKSSACITGDAFFSFIQDGYISPWTAEAHHQNEIVIGAAAAAAGRLAGGYTVVYDGVIGPWFLNTFGAATGLAQLHYVMLLPPEDVCIDRVRTRVGHGFTDLDATRHMYREFAAAATSDRPVVTSTASPHIVAALVAQLVVDRSVVYML